MNEEKPIPPVEIALNTISNQADTLIELMSTLADRLRAVRPTTGLPNGCKNVAFDTNIAEEGNSPVVNNIAITSNKLTSVENQIRSILEDIEI